MKKSGENDEVTVEIDDKYNEETEKMDTVGYTKTCSFQLTLRCFDLTTFDDKSSETEDKKIDMTIEPHFVKVNAKDSA